MGQVTFEAIAEPKKAVDGNEAKKAPAVDGK